MTITEFPTRPSGGVSWKTLARSVHPGDLVTLPRAQATGAQKQLSNYGIRCRTHRNSDGVDATIEILSPVTEKPARLVLVETAATLQHKITEAKENLGYWRRQKLIRQDHQARVQAGVRILIWEAELAALQAKQAQS